LLVVELLVVVCELVLLAAAKELARGGAALLPCAEAGVLIGETNMLARIITKTNPHEAFL
jgi:hypothetical protein